MPMRVDILTLFPGIFDQVLECSILGRARREGLVDVVLTQIRDFALDSYGKVDDRPYGGGPGMVMMCQPVFDAIESLMEADPRPARKILLTPQGAPLCQAKVKALASEPRLMLIAGRYEGFDERIRLGLKTEQISVGDYVLSGGEIPAMAVLDAVVRLLPGALGDGKSVEEESFSEGLLEYPHYTRPENYQGMKVPEILLSGHHARIAAWRREQAEARTRRQRPELLK